MKFYKKLVLTFSFIFIFGVDISFSSTKVYTISRTDVNRIICDDEISEVIFSEEKGLITKTSGKEVFIKFPVNIIVDAQDGSRETIYSDDTAEVFLVCGNTTHSLILKPSNVPAKTITLVEEGLSSKRVHDGDSRDEEELLANLMVLAVNEEVPKTFKKEVINKLERFKRGDVEITFIKKNKYVGQGYTISEYHIHSSSEVTLLTTELISFSRIVTPAALLLTAESFKGWIRGYVIERGVK